MTSNSESIDKKPSVIKRSRAKIWIRTGILVMFTVMFSFALYEDINQGLFPWWAVLVIFAPALAFGFWISRLVPMTAHTEHQFVTLSFDRIYFTLIWTLVIVKFVAGKSSGWQVLADVLMVAILGIMSGRLGGIGLRVRQLKKDHRFI